MVRLGVVPLTLIWLIASAAGRVSFPENPSIALILLAVAVNEVALCIFGARMGSLLRAFEVRITWFDALRIHLQSMYYFVLVPMTVGLELARFAKVRALTPDVPATRILQGLLTDRLIGAASAATVLALAWPFVRFEAAPWAEASAAVWALTALAVAGGVAAVVIAPVRRGVSETLNTVRAHWIRLSAIFVLSMLMHAMFAAGVSVAARALHFGMSYEQALFVSAAGMLFFAVPVSLAGVGAADVAAAGVLIAMGYSVPESILLGALPYIARLIGAVQGGIWEMTEGARALVTTRRMILGDVTNSER